MKKMDPGVLTYTKNVGKDLRSDLRLDNFLTPPLKKGPLIIGE